MLSYVAIKFYFNQLPEMQKLVDLKVECLFLWQNICNSHRLQNVLKIGESTSPLLYNNNTYFTVFIETLNQNQWMYFRFLVLL